MRLFIYLLFAAFCLSPSLVSAQLIYVPQTQRAVISKKTADWCPFCGQWGWTLFENILTDNADRATVLAAHYSGGLSNTVSQSIAANLEGPSQPRFYVNNQDMNATSGNAATVRNSINTLVETIAQQSPIAQSGIRATYLGDQLFIQTSTFLFQDWSEGDLFRGIYLVERSFTSNQAGQGAGAQHKQLLRAVVEGPWYGVSILSGATPSGFIAESRDTIALGSLSPQNLEVVTILWRRNGDSYDIVNTNSTREIAETVVVNVSNQVFQGVSWSVAPNRIEDSSVAVLTLAESHKVVNVSLYNMAGQYLTSFYDGSLGAGRYEFPLDRMLGLPAGAYVLHLQVDGQVNTQKLIVP